MSVEKEQFDKVMGELRRACLPAGSADVVQAYVDSLAGDLARAQASAATLATAGRGAWVRADAVQAQLVEAVGLLGMFDSSGTTYPGGWNSLKAAIDAFLAQAEQQEAQGAQAGDDARKAAFENHWYAQKATAFSSTEAQRHFDAGWMARAALATQPTAHSAALPERRPCTVGTWGDMGDAYSGGWNDCLDAVAALNASPATGPVAAGEPVAWITRPLRGSSKGKAVICQADHTPNLELWEKPFPVYATAHAGELVQYRLLRLGEVILATDELLMDDCITWQPMNDGPQLGIGCEWHVGLVPMRRVEVSERPQGDGVVHE